MLAGDSQHRRLLRIQTPITGMTRAPAARPAVLEAQPAARRQFLDRFVDGARGAALMPASEPVRTGLLAIVDVLLEGDPR